MSTPARKHDGWILAPCPFCCGPPIMTVVLFTDDWQNRIRDPKEETVLKEFEADHAATIEVEIWCHDCGARGYTAEGYGIFRVSEIVDLQDQAVARWNNRGWTGIKCYEPRRYLPYPGGWEDPDGSSWRPETGLVEAVKKKPSKGSPDIVILDDLAT